MVCNHELNRCKLGTGHQIPHALPALVLHGHQVIGDRSSALLLPRAMRTCENETRLSAFNLQPARMHDRENEQHEVFSLQYTFAVQSG